MKADRQRTEIPSTTSRSPVRVCCSGIKDLLLCELPTLLQKLLPKSKFSLVHTSDGEGCLIRWETWPAAAWILTLRLCGVHSNFPEHLARHEQGVGGWGGAMFRYFHLCRKNDSTQNRMPKILQIPPSWECKGAGGVSDGCGGAVYKDDPRGHLKGRLCYGSSIWVVWRTFSQQNKQTNKQTCSDSCPTSIWPHARFGSLGGNIWHSFGIPMKMVPDFFSSQENTAPKVNREKKKKRSWNSNQLTLKPTVISTPATSANLDIWQRALGLCILSTLAFGLLFTHCIWQPLL